MDQSELTEWLTKTYKERRLRKFCVMFGAIRDQLSLDSKSPPARLLERIEKAAMDSVKQVVAVDMYYRTVRDTFERTEDL